MSALRGQGARINRYHMNNELQKENNRLHAAVSDARAFLMDASSRLRSILDDTVIVEETPIEATTVMKLALQAINSATAKLKVATPTGKRPDVPPGGPTRQQGQFLAFIREYMMRNYAGVAPTHAEFQRFFNLTAPSVNSMLVRLEQRSFIRRIPGKARAIELTVNPEWIPPLERPFRVH